MKKAHIQKSKEQHQKACSSSAAASVLFLSLSFECFLLSVILLRLPRLLRLLRLLRLPHMLRLSASFVFHACFSSHACFGFHARFGFQATGGAIELTPLLLRSTLYSAFFRSPLHVLFSLRFVSFGLVSFSLRPSVCTDRSVYTLEKSACVLMLKL